jgi:hypothetical protein
MLLSVGLAAPSLLVGILSRGPFAGRVLQGGLVLLGLCAVAAIWMWRQGARLDREQDEREQVILGRSASFTCLVTAVALQTYWAVRFAADGNAGDDVFWVLVVFWGAFAASYVYNWIRA